MKALQSLDQIKQIGKESFFHSQLELFWLDYQNSDENRKFEKWDGQDSFKVYYSHVDILDPLKMGYFEISLTKILRKQIEGMFETLNFELNVLIAENKKTAKDNVSEMFVDLQEVSDNILKLKLPGDYQSFIFKTFNLQVQHLRKKVPKTKIREKKKTWRVIYRDEVITESERFNDDGRFNDFFKRLKEEEFLSASTRSDCFKQFFSDKVPSRKIEWTKEGPSELYTIIRMLEDRGYIKTHRKWSAIRDSFITKFPLKNLHSTTPVTDIKNLEKISEIVDELKI